MKPLDMVSTEVTKHKNIQMNVDRGSNLYCQIFYIVNNSSEKKGTIKEKEITNQIEL